MSANRLTLALTFLSAFLRSRYGFRFANRAALERWQTKKIQRLLKCSAQRLEFYRDYANDSLDAWPVMTKTRMQQHFTALNRAGISLQQAQQFGLAAEQQGAFATPLQAGIAVGLSSGTSGQRGVFLVSDQERARWAGVILARVLNRAHLLQLLNPLAKPLSVAFLLRANSRLYTTVANRRLHFHYGDLQRSLGELINWLQQIQPQILIAPASVLAALARAQLQQQLQIEPGQVISVAEVLEADDKHLAEQAWQVPLAQVYQCTEGLLAYTCEHGRLHLNEEWLHIAPQWLDQTRFLPEITDFSRDTQAFIRYQLDDVLRLDTAGCQCGRHSRVIAAIEGRQDDVLWLPALSDGQLLPLFPDKLRHLILQLQPDTQDYRIEQHGMVWHCRLLPTLSQAGTTASELSHLQQHMLTAIAKLCQQQHVRQPELQFAAWQTPLSNQKRRRIRCLSAPMKESH